MTATVTALPTRAIWADLDPFEIVADELPGWTLAFAALDDFMGICDPDTRTIWIDIGLDRRQRRSTIMHEIIHAQRGDETDDPVAERIVQVETARRLVPAAELAPLLASTPDLATIAEALDVDLCVLRTRIRDLYPDDADTLIQSRSQPHLSGTDGAFASWFID